MSKPTTRSIPDTGLPASSSGRRLYRDSSSGKSLIYCWRSLWLTADTYHGSWDGLNCCNIKLMHWWTRFEWHRQKPQVANAILKARGGRLKTACFTSIKTSTYPSLTLMNCSAMSGHMCAASRLVGGSETSIALSILMTTLRMVVPGDSVCPAVTR